MLVSDHPLQFPAPAPVAALSDDRLQLPEVGVFVVGVDRQSPTHLHRIGSVLLCHGLKHTIATIRPDLLQRRLHCSLNDIQAESELFAVVFQLRAFEHINNAL